VLEGIISTAVVIVVGILGFLLRGYFGSYVSEKGKNLATKEDIAQITTQIENVKASIQTLAQLKTDYEQQRRQWLLSFYDSSVEMLYEKFSVNFGDLPSDEGRSLFEFQQSFRVLAASMVKEYQRIVLYFENEDPLRINAESVLNAALEAESVVRRRFGRIKITLLEEVAAFKSGERQRMEEAVAKSNEANKVYWDDMRPIVTTFRDALRQYLTFVNLFLRKDSEIDSQILQRSRT
jgi:hypothetical protein